MENKLTREVTVKWLFSRMAAHMSLERIAAGMGHPLSRAGEPLARISLLPALNVHVVDVLNQVIHILESPGRATVPFAMSNLLLEVFLIEAGVGGRARDVP